jgi:hypothetical protein
LDSTQLSLQTGTRYDHNGFLLISFRLATRRREMGRKAAGAPHSKASTQRKPKIDLPVQHPIDEFKAVARLITPDPPDWLAEHLMSWAPTIFLSKAAELRQPTRAEMVEILTKVRDAAALLQRALAQPSVCEFLDAGGSEPLDAHFKFRMVVGELQLRADRASKLPNLVDKKGKVKAGRGHAQPDGAISTQTYCALLIAEAWKWFRGEYPAPRNKRAAQAIDLCWQLAGGKRETSWGNNPLTAWRYHLKAAATIPAEQERAELRRHMREHVRQVDLLKSEAAGESGK